VKPALKLQALKLDVRAPFGGRARTFRLRLGEAGALERECNAGIGHILMRLGTGAFYAADIRETIFQGLRGAGETDPAATALVKAVVDEEPLAEHLQLACDIIRAYILGLPDVPAGKEQGETLDPATSPPGTNSPAP